MKLEMIVTSFCSRLLRFPNLEIHYPVPIAKPNKCLGSVNKDHRHIQCPNPQKDKEYCGIHKKGKTPFIPREMRHKKFAELETYGSGFFILDPCWITKTFDDIYPPLVDVDLKSTVV